MNKESNHLTTNDLGLFNTAPQSVSDPSACEGSLIGIAYCYRDRRRLRASRDQEPVFGEPGRLFVAPGAKRSHKLLLNNDLPSVISGGWVYFDRL
jgi:hypothetical protein